VRAYVLAKLQGRMGDDRQYPTSFRSLLDADGEVARGAGGGRAGEVVLRVRCHCGQCSSEVCVSGLGGQLPAAIHCYCEGCRRFHTSAFGAYLALATDAAPTDWEFGGRARRHSDACAALGRVDRVLCSRCFGKLATLPREGGRRGQALLALGAVEDSSVPDSCARLWQQTYEQWEQQAAPAWWSAAPAPRQGPSRTADVRGRCACGDCAFVAAILPGEAQHCYCGLCRRLSGAASMTWVPCENEAFRWTKRESLRLVRTTRHGQRHVCVRCGGVLTIVYDAQPDCTWPVAGALEDASLPEDLSQCWYRVIHICCSMMQPWYRLPDDGLPRLKYAG